MEILGIFGRGGGRSEMIKIYRINQKLKNLSKFDDLKILKKMKKFYKLINKIILYGSEKKINWNVQNWYWMRDLHAN